MKDDHLILFEVMQGNDRDGIEGWLKDFISLFFKRLEFYSRYIYFLSFLSSSFFLHVFKLICMFKLILQIILIVFNISKTICMFNFVICVRPSFYFCPNLKRLSQISWAQGWPIGCPKPLRQPNPSHSANSALTSFPSKRFGHFPLRAHTTPLFLLT